MTEGLEETYSPESADSWEAPAPVETWEAPESVEVQAVDDMAPIADSTVDDVVPIAPAFDEQTFPDYPEVEELPSGYVEEALQDLPEPMPSDLPQDDMADVLEPQEVPAEGPEAVALPEYGDDAVDTVETEETEPADMPAPESADIAVPEPEAEVPDVGEQPVDMLQPIEADELTPSAIVEPEFPDMEVVEAPTPAEAETPCDLAVDGAKEPVEPVADEPAEGSEFPEMSETPESEPEAETPELPLAPVDEADSPELPESAESVGPRVPEAIEGTYDEAVPVDVVEPPVVCYDQGIVTVDDVDFAGTCGPTTVSNTMNTLFGGSAYDQTGVLTYALDNGLCNVSDDPAAAGGTTTQDLVDIYEGIAGDKVDVETFEGTDLPSTDEIAARVEDGSVVNVGVHADTLWGAWVPRNAFFDALSPRTTDHWIEIHDVERDTNGEVTGFDIVDSGGSMNYVDKNVLDEAYAGTHGREVRDPVCLVVSRKDGIPAVD